MISQVKLICSLFFVCVFQRSGPGDVTDPAVKGGDDLGQRNLLTLITFLTDQVSRLLDGMAGMKLLQAATTPIHGLLHCIFALVKRVPFLLVSFLSVPLPAF